jgi:hypothetical protein
MKFKQALNEKVKDGHKRLASATGGSATPLKIDNYLTKIDKEGKVKKIEKQIKKKGLKGKSADAYKWSVLHKMMKGHFD